MKDEAHRVFCRAFAAHLAAQFRTAAEDMPFRDKVIRDKEKVHANLMHAIESGAFSQPVIDRLNEVDAELA